MGDIEERKRTIRKKTKNLYEATKTLNDLRNKLITVYFIKNNAVKSLLNVFDEGIVEKIKETDLNNGIISFRKNNWETHWENYKDIYKKTVKRLILGEKE